MPLSFQTYPFDLGDVRDWLAETLPTLEPDKGEAARHAELELIGPFPAYYLDPREFVGSGVQAAKRTGWRALVQHDEEPLAIVEISFSTGGEPRYATRSSDAATAFAEALNVVAETNADGDFEVRWLSMADIYVTALWLSGAEDIFIPTRLGSAERIRPKALRTDELRPIVRVLIERSKSRPRATSLLEGFFDRFAKSPRSGLPDE